MFNAAINYTVCLYGVYISIDYSWSLIRLYQINEDNQSKLVIQMRPMSHQDASNAFRTLQGSFEASKSDQDAFGRFARTHKCVQGRIGCKNATRTLLVTLQGRKNASKDAKMRPGRFWLLCKDAKMRPRTQKRVFWRPCGLEPPYIYLLTVLIIVLPYWRNHG